MLGYNIQFLPDALLGENPYLIQVRTHKKKRINKKWAKRYGYVTKYKTFNTVVFNNTIFMTKQTFQDLQRGTDLGDADGEDSLRRTAGRGDVENDL